MVGRAGTAIRTVQMREVSMGEVKREVQGHTLPND